jgi:demethylmenaquinone methyltransferase/2-methoxy-6-polyprenyl-1,4-benzoquinol methylase
MILTNEEIKLLYKRTAIFYDRALLLYRLLGIDRHRRVVVSKLRLQPADTVADLGCGTGANFPALIEAVGPDGRVVGFDLSGAMLDKARERTARNRWKNVELFEADIRDCALPEDMAGAISAFAMEMVPEYDAVVARVARCLPIGGRLGPP